MPLDKFKNYFVKIVYGVHKVIGKDGVDMVYGVEFIIARDVQESYYGGEYDYVEYILANIGLAQNEEMEKFSFHHYSLLMHLILYKNVGYISPDFIDHITNVDGELPVQLWTWVWDTSYHYFDCASFFNNFSTIIMKMLDLGYFRAPKVLKSLLRPTLLP